MNNNAWSRLAFDLGRKQRRDSPERGCLSLSDLPSACSTRLEPVPGSARAPSVLTVTPFWPLRLEPSELTAHGGNCSRSARRRHIVVLVAHISGMGRAPVLAYDEPWTKHCMPASVDAIPDTVVRQGGSRRRRRLATREQGKGAHVGYGRMVERAKEAARAPGWPWITRYPLVLRQAADRAAHVLDQPCTPRPGPPRRCYAVARLVPAGHRDPAARRHVPWTGFEIRDLGAVATLDPLPKCRPGAGLAASCPTGGLDQARRLWRTPGALGGKYW